MSAVMTLAAGPVPVLTEKLAPLQHKTKQSDLPASEGGLQHSAMMSATCHAAQLQLAELQQCAPEEQRRDKEQVCAGDAPSMP